MSNARWWEENDPELEQHFGEAVNEMVRNWMVNKISYRAGLNSHMTGRAAVVHVAGNMNAPGAERCFREVAAKLGIQNTAEALVLRLPFTTLFPSGAVANAQRRLQAFGN